LSNQKNPKMRKGKDKSLSGNQANRKWVSGEQVIKMIKDE
jgi:hypothetical protein